MLSRVGASGILGAIQFEAFQGELTASHLFVLNEILEHIEALEARIARFDTALLDGLADEHNTLVLLQTLPGVCPGHNESAGKRKSGRARKGNPYVRRSLCEFAQAARRTQSVFKSKFESLVVRRGHKRSIIAIVHKLLRTIFHMIQHQQPYHDTCVDYQALSVKRNAPRWIKILRQRGYINAPT